MSTIRVETEPVSAPIPLKIKTEGVSKKKRGKKVAQKRKPGKASKKVASQPAPKKLKKSATERSKKKDAVIALMKRPQGATLDQIVEATGWQKHTVRGFVSVLGNKEGSKVESFKNEGQRTYKLGK